MTEVCYQRGLSLELAASDFLLADECVLQLHPRLDAGTAKTVGTAGTTQRLSIPGGEQCKSFAMLERVLRALASARLSRKSTLHVVGGGTLCDLGGLCASLYMRGIELVLVPTTLLAMCDASIGGKTAINLPEGKNLVGTFWPARRVWIDVDLLGTLPEAELHSGLGEVVKIAIGLSSELFALLCSESESAKVRARDPATLARVVALCIAAKQQVVAEDPREQDQRRLLNLGHTLAHALEAHSGFELAHGLAVARGLYWAIDLSAERGLITKADAAACRDLLLRYGFEPWPLPDPHALEPFLALDKKGGALVLPTGIGKSAIF